MKKVFALFAITTASLSADPYSHAYYQEKFAYQQSGKAYQNQTQNQQSYYQVQPVAQANISSVPISSEKQKIISDDDISKNVRDVLLAVLLENMRSVTFEVNQGKVTLKGSVDSTEKKDKIAENVRRIEGVKTVDDQITVNNEK